jgi:hypothetical protein
MAVVLPAPILANLPEIERVVKKATRSIYEREKLASYVSQVYFNLLFQFYLNIVEYFLI